MSRLDDVFLHNRSHNTNMSIPHSDYISFDKYPEQDTNLIATYITIQYRDMYRSESEYFYSITDFDEERDHFSKEFYIVRCDIVEPYIMIGISKDYSIIAVTDSRYYNETVFEYPIQSSEFINVLVSDIYETKEVKGTIIRCDMGEPCYTVIMEELEDGAIRFVLGDECLSKLNTYNPELVFTELTKDEIDDIRKSLLESIIGD